MFLVHRNYAMQKNNLTVIIVLKSLAFASYVSGQILRVWVRSPPFLKFLIFQCGCFEKFTEKNSKNGYYKFTIFFQLFTLILWQHQLNIEIGDPILNRTHSSWETFGQERSNAQPIQKPNRQYHSKKDVLKTLWQS